MGIRGQYKNKRDGNEAGIFTMLRSHGLIVCPMDTPCDAVVGYGGHSYLVEVKMPKAPFTKAQKEFLKTWIGNYKRLETVEEAEAFAKKVRAQ
tara:strand:- start:4550 stop:4828 length:279 start_codon:yes stop_codon:yes gene_type:complete